ncbi:hypothetical protein NDU88_007356 [Pleurodeles waltl]|uniref:Reverse transcriptase domain-containing protein n=1 Tax=Pleurodeles waltl TaxID=8319 RepID=A0AAV7SS64_PLEWA|nr:hypothetical protein NDU88_007356 [Pleurodeles waltl]
MDDAAKLLVEMVGEDSLTDVIGSMGPDARNFTWSRPDRSVRSRIDYVFTSKSVRIRQHSMVTVHLSDHRAIRFQGELTGKFLTGPGTWKLNSSLLGREDVQEELRRTYKLLAEYIRKKPNIRGITTPGDAKKEVKCTLYMDDVTLFCTDGKSVQSLLEACKDFGKASGAKINVDKSQAKLFGRWDLCNEPLPFPIEAGLVKILGIWFGGPGAAAKSWNERLAKVQLKLGFWSLRNLSIEGKTLVLRNDALPVLQYVTQAWPLLANVARAVNSIVFHFVWHSKMNRVKRTVMHKVHRKGGKAVPNIPTILRSFFVCGCVRITLTNENKDHSAYRVFRFFLLPVWRRLGWEKWENATMFNWDLPWYYKEIEKFVVEFGLNCVTPSLWKPRTIHRLIRSRDTREPMSDLPPATATRVTRLVTNGEVVSREACRTMVHNLLRDYKDKDNKEREKEEEL